MKDPFERLQSWFSSQCDGDWEHHNGISIVSCDNPGWLVKSELTGSALAGKPFDPREEGVNAEGFPLGGRWFHCYTRDEVWVGSGDETRLPEILRTFLDWAAPEESATKLGDS